MPRAAEAGLDAEGWSDHNLDRRMQPPAARPRPQGAPARRTTTRVDATRRLRTTRAGATRRSRIYAGRRRCGRTASWRGSIARAGGSRPSARTRGRAEIFLRENPISAVGLATAAVSPRRGRGGAASRLLRISSSWPRWCRVSSPRNVHVAASPRFIREISARRTYAYANLEVPHRAVEIPRPEESELGDRSGGRVIHHLPEREDGVNAVEPAASPSRRGREDGPRTRD